MNPKVIRENLIPKKGNRVKIKINGMRNKTDEFIGVLEELYPEIFTVRASDYLRSFSYSEIINKEVELSFI